MNKIMPYVVAFVVGLAITAATLLIKSNPEGSVPCICNYAKSVTKSGFPKNYYTKTTESHALANPYDDTTYNFSWLAFLIDAAVWSSVSLTGYWIIVNTRRRA